MTTLVQATMNNPEGRGGQKELSINHQIREIERPQIPTLRTTSTSPVASSNNASMAEAWEDAKVQFQKKAGKSLSVSTAADLEQALNKLALHFKSKEDKATPKNKRLKQTGQNIIAGLQVVGGIVAQGVSPAFPPAGICFSALSFLLTIPSNISAVFSTVQELFEETEDFLVRFKILKRIDAHTRLDPDMVTAAGFMLISFIEICALSIYMLEHKKMTSFKAALVNDDSGAGNLLVGFRRQALKLDRLTTSISFEHLVDLKSVANKNTAMLTETGADVKLLVAADNLQQIEIVNSRRISTIEDRIYARDERNSAAKSAQTPDYEETLIEGTLDALRKHQKYYEWMDSLPSHGRKELLLCGESGTGKSRMLHALKGDLDEARRKAPTDKDTVYVALYVFDDRRAEATASIQTPNQFGSRIPAALRNMAVQVARQSTRYASTLEECLAKDKHKSLSQLDDVEDLWQQLQLSTFNAPSGATMYLLFDGLEQEGEKAKSLITMLSEFCNKKEGQQDTLKIRSFFTVDESLRSSVTFNVRSAQMNEIGINLRLRYAEIELRRHGLFQNADSKSQARQTEVIEAVKGRSSEDDPATKLWSFAVIKGKLQQINNACQNGAPGHELSRILRDEYEQTEIIETKRKLQDLASSLSADQIQQIQQVIPWLLYSRADGYITFDEVEAVLSLADCGDSLQSFEQQMGKRFRDLFERNGGLVRLSPEYEDFLRQGEDDPMTNPVPKIPRISMNISIQNAEESVVRQFIWNLNEQMSTGKFEFLEGAATVTQSISANKLEGHLSITTLCLKLLNEGWQRGTTDILVGYAAEFLPKHLAELQEKFDDIPKDQQTIVSQGLVSFLSDPYYLAEDPDQHFGSGQYWLRDVECISGMRFWLESTRVNLHAHQKRWVDKALQSAEGELGFVKTLALAVGQKWTSHLREDAKENGRVLRFYKTGGFERRLFSWLDAFIEINTTPVDRGADREPNGDAKEPTKQPGRDETVENAESLKEGQKLSPADSLTLTNNHPPEPEVISKESISSRPSEDRVERALQWLRERVVVDESCGPFRINIGYTYLEQGDLDQAERHFLAARENELYRRQALAGLARVSAARIDLEGDHQAVECRKHRQEAARFLSEAIDILVLQSSQQPLSRDEKDVHAELVHETAMIYRELESEDETVPLYKTALQCSDDFNMRWDALEFFCKRNLSHDVLELLSKWPGTVDGMGEETLAQAIYRSARNDPTCTQLRFLIPAIEDKDVRGRFQILLSEAVEMAKKESQSQATPGLLYLLGLAYGSSSEAEQREQAVQHWRKALNLVSPDNAGYEYQYSVYLAAKAVALDEFDRWKTMITSTAAAQLPKERKSELIQQLQHNITARALYNRNINLYQAQAMLARYVNSGSYLLGQVDKARQDSAGEMRFALRILLDDDPENDLQGIYKLLEIFYASGDRVNTLTAFSLLDRPKFSKKDDAATSEATANKVATVPQERTEGLVRSCDGCGKTLESKDPDGYWCCQFCDDLDLCSACQRKLVDGRLNVHLCRPSHNWIHVYHTDYTPEETADGRIRVDWEWVDLGDGHFERKGGRIVAISEWLEDLRILWKIENLEGSKVIAQK